MIRLEGQLPGLVIGISFSFILFGLFHLSQPARQVVSNEGTLSGQTAPQAQENSNSEGSVSQTVVNIEEPIFDFPGELLDPPQEPWETFGAKTGRFVHPARIVEEIRKLEPNPSNYLVSISLT